MNMKRFKKWLFGCLLLSLIALASCTKASIDESETSNPSNNTEISDLPLILTSASVSQDSRLNQIKADLLVANGGYLDSDRLITIFQLKEDSLITQYNEKYSSKYSSVVDFSNSFAGRSILTRIENEQEDFLNKLTNKGYSYTVDRKYDTILNAVAVELSYKDYKELSKNSAVSSTMISETYNMPKTTTTNTSGSTAVSNIVDVYDTGIFNSSSAAELGYSGANTAVAILDSGFDCTHTVFAKEPKNPVITQDSIGAVLSQTKAAEGTEGLIVDDVYFSAKIPFAYDYADKDYDVNPSTSNHGTHVAGIIGGDDDTITGVAVNTQLVLLKVFGDESSGAGTEDILAALEDSIKLEVDAINMSLGTSCGFARESDEEGINEVYEAIDKAGISLIAAASNSYSSGFGGENGNTNKVTNPDSATVGSPATYDTSLAVASISGTKSRYFVTSTNKSIYFIEANSNSGVTKDFYKELYTSKGWDFDSEEEHEIEYVTVPGVGLNVNYSSIDVNGKIALVKRGNNTFAEKVEIAQANGAIGVIIYNNVAGDISMSLGASTYIPTVSLSKDDGEILAASSKGKLTISTSYQAGPFMSAFSSWGPNANLTLKPEITAHGGNILSSVPGGGYDTLSGTSMASPNMCGVIVLIRQYLKENFPSYTPTQINTMAYQLLMSTATIALDEEGNPYSPRRQGAGLASLSDAISTRAYATVDGNSKTKLELGDDPNKTGIYTMKFNVVNISQAPISYKVDVNGLTESVSTSDSDYVAEAAQLLNGSASVVSVNGESHTGGNIVTVAANSSASIEVQYTLPDGDMEMINSSFPNGIYIEGYATLTPTDSKDCDLNIPFLAFYGDWTQAPLFDKTYYDVQEDVYNNAIDDEDKTKADYYATTPYGSYGNNYMIPLGSYVYTVDTSKYEQIPATEEHIAMSDGQNTIDGISAIYGGLLRNAKTMTYTITDTITGEVIYTHLDVNGNKAYSEGGSTIPYYELLGLHAADLNLINGRKYYFEMKATLDYDLEETRESQNLNDTFSFTFTFDNQAPVVQNATYERVYDTTTKKYRYYANITVYDNHFAHSITPISFTKMNDEGQVEAYTALEKYPIPIYGKEDSSTTVRFEITNYINTLYEDVLISSSLAFIVEDYALNSNIYLAQLPGTNGVFSFTEDGNVDSEPSTLFTVYEGETLDLYKYLATTDTAPGQDKEYMKFLNWGIYISDSVQLESANEFLKIDKGVVVGLKASNSRFRIRVYDAVAGRYADVYVRVRAARSATSNVENQDSTTLLSTKADQPNYATPRASVNDASLESLDFVYFDTVYAHPSGSESSQIGITGDRIYVSSLRDTLSTYPGESIKLAYQINPWYLDSSRYTLDWQSTNTRVATVDQNGVVTMKARGSATIRLRITVDGRLSNIMASIKIAVQNEFIIEGSTLVYYKGAGGDVVIPANEGILSISPYAFTLYSLDNDQKVDADNPYANRVPAGNKTITSITLPDGLTTISRYAFYGLEELTTVIVPDSLETIEMYAFYGNKKLTTIDLSSVHSISRYAFYECSSLKNIDLSKIFSIGSYAFQYCSSLESVDLSTLRNTGVGTFADCTKLKSITTNSQTKLSNYMFYNSGLTSVNLSVDRIPEGCFENCSSLTSVTLTNSALVYLGVRAFNGCTSLATVSIDGTIKYIYDEVFNNCTSLEVITLPNSSFTLGKKVFNNCKNLKTLVFQANTELISIDDSAFNNVLIDTYNVLASTKYTSSNKMLLSNDGSKIVLAGNVGETVTIPSSITEIGRTAFSGNKSIKSLVLEGNVNIEEYAFSNCSLESVTFTDEQTTIMDYSFANNSKLTTVNGLDLLSVISAYSFYNSALVEITLKDDVVLGNNAFGSNSLLQIVNFLGDATIGSHAFAENAKLESVNSISSAVINIGDYAFYNNTALVNIDLTSAGPELGDYAFYNNTALKAANLTNVKIIGSYAFAAARSIESVTLPVVEEIKEYAFARITGLLIMDNAPKITEINFPSTLRSIGSHAFYYSSRLTSITIPEGVREIADYAFSNTISVESVTLSSSIKTIKDYAFNDARVLNSINLSNVQEIGKYAFASCKALTSVDLASAKLIDDNAFDGATALTEIKNTSNIEYIGQVALRGTKIKTFDASSAKTISSLAFRGCTLLEKVILSKDITELGNQAFFGASSLEKLVVLDNGEEKSTFDINSYAKLVNNILYTKLANGNYMLAAIPQALDIKTLEVMDGVSYIAPYSGNSNRYITKIILPATVLAIGHYAFYGYNNLKSVEFQSFIAPKLESQYMAPENSLDTSYTLLETDPGYSLLKPMFDFFGEQLNYYNFKALVGKREPISMTLPSNAVLQGYDSIVYEAYFGKVSDATRSDIVAMDTTTLNYLNNVVLIPSPSNVTLLDDELISQTVAYYNALIQDLTDFGYTESQIDEMAAKLNNALVKLNELKREQASDAVKNTQNLINSLPDNFSIDKLNDFRTVYNSIYSLTISERNILDLTKYNKILAQYEAYVLDISEDANGITTIVNNSFAYNVVATVLACAQAIAMALYVFRKFN